VFIITTLNSPHDDDGNNDSASSTPPPCATSPPCLLPRLSSDFSLLPEIERAHFAFPNYRTRLRWMMRRYRRSPSLGLLENKLFTHSIVKEVLGGTPIPILYGALATKALGDWPRYNRTAFKRAMAGRRRFVLKPATNGGGKDVLIMTPQRYDRERWDADKLADFAEAFFAAARRWSSWGQRYVHVGVIVQEYLGDDDALELKVYVCFGKMIREASALPLPLPLPRDNRGEPIVGANRAMRLLLDPAAGAAGAAGRAAVVRLAPKQFKNYEFRRGMSAAAGFEKVARPLLEHPGVLACIADVAARAGEAFAADWFRLDVFVGRGGGDNDDGDGGVMVVVNELSYPSHLAEPEASGQLAGMYQRREYEAVNASTVLAELAPRIGVDLGRFESESDVPSLGFASEEEYDQSKWMVKEPPR